MYRIILCFFIVGLLFCSCENDILEQKFVENDFNLPDIVTIDTLGIKIDVSKYFLDSTNYSWLKTTNLFAEKRTDVVSLVGGRYASIFLGIVKYTYDEISESNTNENNVNIKDNSSIELLHAYIRNKRIESIKKDILLSEPQLLFTRTQKHGIIQSIEEQHTDYTLNRQYLLATFTFNGAYYVFHLIANNEISQYLFDDFLAMIKSVRL